MWRALLGRRVVLLVLALGLSAGLSAWWLGPEPAGGYSAAPAGAEPPAELVRDNVVAALARRFRIEVDPIDLRILMGAPAPTAMGRPFVAWFTAGDGTLAELYSTRGQIASTGVPLNLSTPRNVSRTPDGNELLLDATDDRVLYAVQVGDRVPSVVLLDFGRSWLPEPEELPWSTRLAAAAAARQAFGTWDGPERTDLVLTRPTALVAGQLKTYGFELVTDDVEIVVAPETSTVLPEEAAEILTGAPPEQAPLNLAADVLRRSAIVGAQRVMAIEDTLFAVADWLRRQRHRLFPTAADRLPVSPLVDVPLVKRSWPPPRVATGSREVLPGEGEWKPVETEVDALDPLALQTFVRVEPERPYERTHLIAFDTRRLGLQFVAGTRHPRSATGVRGTGRIAADHRDGVFAAFNGGFKAEHGRFGTVEQGRTIIPPVRGLSTVVVAPDGRAGFGLWDAEALHPPWTALRQNLAPLIERGVVNPQRVHHWGKLVADLDDARTPRSALGVTADGVLVYGWSRAISAERLGEALRRAGVRFAMHLDMNPGHTGLELYRPGADGIDAVRAVPEMDHRPRRWLGTDARDFFYLMRVDRRPAPLPLEMRAVGEGEWSVGRRLDGATVLADTWLSAERTGSRRQVPVMLLETDRVRPHVVPGLAEIPPTTGIPPAALDLEGMPIGWLEIGLRTRNTPFGFVVGGRVWRPLQPGVMTFAVDADGRARVGRLGEGVPDSGEWADVIQGPALVADGHVADGARGRGTMPVAGMGMRDDGRLLFAAGLDGDRAALGRALAVAGARHAVLLGERGTVDTGSRTLFFARGDRLWAARSPTGALRPARLAAGAGTALVVTGRRPPPSVRILPTFARTD